VAIALDRQEKATENGQDVSHGAPCNMSVKKLGLQVCAIARWPTSCNILQVHAGDELGTHHAKVLAYRDRYGAG
jgi:orotate phosphoribosyltransferase